LFKSEETIQSTSKSLHNIIAIPKASTFNRTSGIGITWGNKLKIVFQLEKITQLKSISTI